MCLWWHLVDIEVHSVIMVDIKGHSVIMVDIKGHSVIMVEIKGHSVITRLVKEILDKSFDKSYCRLTCVLYFQSHSL